MKKFISNFLSLSIYNKMLISLILTSLVSVSVIAYAAYGITTRIIINKAIQSSLTALSIKVLKSIVETDAHIFSKMGKMDIPFKSSSQDFETS